MYSTVTQCLKGLKYHILVGFFICSIYFYIKVVEMVKINSVADIKGIFHPKICHHHHDVPKMTSSLPSSKIFSECLKLFLWHNIMVNK